MSETTIPFYTQAAVLDQFIHAAHPAEDAIAVEVVTELLQRNESLRAYFIRNRPNPAWIPVLWNHGFFASPPDPIIMPEGERLPFWDMQEYLLSVAADVPEYVLRHVNTIQGPPIYIERAVRGLTLLPLGTVHAAFPRVLDWLKDYPTAVTLVEDVLTLINLLADENTEAALTLFEAVSSPFPNPRATKIEGYTHGSEAVSLMQRYHLHEEEFRTVVENFIHIDAPRLAAILEAHLQKALRIEADTSGAEYRLSSWWWRSAIEPSGQNHHHDYKDDLLDFLRDVYEYMVAQDDALGSQLTSKLLQKSSPMLRRLGLHLLRLHLTAFLPMVRTELLTTANYDDSSIHHEFLLLLQAGYPQICSEDKQEIMRILLAGPPEARVTQLADMSAERGGPDDEEYKQGYSEHWTLTRLWMLRDHLEGQDAEALRKLETKRGTPEHPAFLSWSSGVYSVRNVSPLSAEQLGTYNAGELVAFLRQWQPAEEQTVGPEHISREGLANAVAGIVDSNVTEYAAELATLLSLQPEYGHAILLQVGNRARNKEVTVSEWATYLDACEVLLASEVVATGMERTSQVGWRDVRQRIVSLLQEAVTNDAEQMEALLPQIKNMLLQLLNDPDPDLEGDRPQKGWHGHNDPHTVAINHVRPSALIGLTEYAQRHAGLGPDKDGGPGAQRLEEDVRNAFTKMLQDSSRAVHSVFGRQLMLLYWLDKAWVIAHLDAIFPTGEDEAAVWMYIAAWEAYTIFHSSLYPALFEMLRPMYERAVDNLSRGYASNTHLEPVRGLLSHLLFDYFENEQVNNATRFDSLLYRFFEQAGGEERGNAAWMIWRTLKDRKEANTDVSALWLFARILWQDRIDKAAILNFPSDFGPEMAWYVELLEFAPPQETLVTLWPLLTGTLHYVADNNTRSRIWHAYETYLADQVETDPVRSIDLFAQICEVTDRPIWAFDDATMRTIIETAVLHPNARAKTLSLIDHLARKGDLRFRDLYERFAS